MKILVVDDEPTIRFLLKRILELENHEVIACDCVKSALNQLMSDKFDFIFTDLNMPGSNGLELLEIIKNIEIKVPVVVVTGNSYIEREHLNKYNIMELIKKPFQREEIVDVLNIEALV